MVVAALIALMGVSFADGSPAPIGPIGGYTPGDVVWNGHTADLDTLVVCAALFDTDTDRRSCIRVAACESGSDPAAVNDNGDGHHDLGRWQHNTRYTAARLTAIGDPTGDPLDLWTNALMTHWYHGQLGDTFGTTAGWHCAPLVGAR